MFIHCYQLRAYFLAAPGNYRFYRSIMLRGKHRRTTRSNDTALDGSNFGMRFTQNSRMFKTYGSNNSQFLVFKHIGCVIFTAQSYFNYLPIYYTITSPTKEKIKRADNAECCHRSLRAFMLGFHHRLHCLYTGSKFRFAYRLKIEGDLFCI